MDAVFFSLKRAHHATLRWGRRGLRPCGLTPARFDVLFALTRLNVKKTQAGLRWALGVARATISEMLAVLEDIGWIERTRDPDDGRTYRVALTGAGRDILERAYAFAVGAGVVPLAVESALTRGDAEEDPFQKRETVDWLCGLIRRYFGDSAVDELYRWHPDDYLSGLTDDPEP
jgi:DNA-binding MarR family transcriptional regulator